MKAFPDICTLEELLRSARAAKLGIANVPTTAHLHALQALAWTLFVPLRHAMGQPLDISSGYRSAALNKATPGASRTSQHNRGEAMDVVASDTARAAGVTNATLFTFVRTTLPFDQLIWEHGTDDEPQWIHMSYAFGRAGRREVLRATKNANGSPHYAHWSAP